MVVPVAASSATLSAARVVVTVGASFISPTLMIRVSETVLSPSEAIKVIYNPNVISFETLVDVFFGSHDPSTLNQQGPDRGTQYRSVAFYSNEVEQKIINDKIDELLEMKIFKIITTEVKKFEKFYLAEEYHQDYKKKNPYNPYIMKVSAPRINKFKLNYSELLKDN